MSNRVERQKHKRVSKENIENRYILIDTQNKVIIINSNH